MNCEEISELLPAYVLGALEPDEVEAIEAHLRAGREHDAELVELRATVFALDRLNVEQETPAAAAPPPGLRAMAAGATTSRSSTAPAKPRAWRIAGAIAAALLLFAAGLATGQILFGGGETYAYALQGEDGAFMEVRGDTSADSVTVIMTGLMRLEGRSYQVWALRDGDWVSIGVCNTNAEGRWVGDFPFSIEADDLVALTVEPQGGSASPTAPPVLGSMR